MRVSSEFKVGILVVLSMLLIFIAINFLKDWGNLSQVREFTVEFKESNGLEPQDAVLLHGVQVGEVIEVGLHENDANRVVVKFNIEDESIKIRKDSELWLVSQDVLGTKALDLRIPEDSIAFEDLSYYESGDHFDPDFVNVAQSMGDSFEEQFDPIEEKATEIISNVQDMIVKVSIFWDTSAAYMIDESMYDVRDASVRVTELKDNINNLSAREKKRLLRIQNSANNINGKVNKISNSITKLSNNVTTINSYYVKANTAVLTSKIVNNWTKIDTVFKKLGAGNGSIGIWTKTAKLTDEIDSTTKKWNSLVSHLNSRPKDFFSFSIFGLKAEGYQPDKDDKKTLDGVLDSLESGKEIDYKEN